MKKIALFIMLNSLAYGVYADVAIFAGGCFWCTQADLSKVVGVESTQVGYDGGTIKSPTYQLVSSGTTHYVESVRVVFDSKKISYKELVNYFLHTVDVTQGNGQFCDIGAQYKSVIFYLNHDQKEIASEVLKTLSKSVPNIKTDLIPSVHFYPGEDYHQNYAIKNPVRYKYYRWRCGRDKQLKQLWGKNIQ